MAIDVIPGVSHWLIAFVGLAVLVVGALAVAMRLRHQYSPNLIGALIGALFCFALLEALPALL